MNKKIKLSLVSLLLLSSLEATTLKEAIQLGVSNDPEVQSKIESFKKTKISISYAQSGYYPKLDLTAGAGVEKTQRENRHGAANTDTSKTRSEASLKFRQPIFEGMKTVNEVDSVRASNNTAKYELLALYENKSLKIVNAYMDVLKAKAIITAADENLETHNAILEHIEQRFKQGVSNRADLLQIKGRVANAQSDLLAAKNNMIDAQEYYLKSVGEEPINLQIPNTDIILPSSKQDAVKKSISSHPTMLTARQKVLEVQSKKSTYESDYYPHFYLDALAQHQDNAEGIDGSYDKYNAMLRMEWNIFNGAREMNQIEMGQQEVLSAQNNTNETRRELVLETGLAWNAHEILLEQIKPLSKHVDYAKEVKVIYEDQYNVGRRTLIDVLNAQVEYFNASKALITAKYDEQSAQYRVLNSMGTLNGTLGINLYGEVE